MKQRNEVLLHDSTLPHISLRPGTAKLVYADPPFNLGVDYDEYHDAVKDGEYVTFAEKWVGACTPLLLPAGFFVVCAPPRWVHTYESAMQKHGLVFHDHVIWHRTFGVQSNTPARLSNAHTTLLVYARPDAKAVWDRHKIPSARLLDYNDHRADRSGKIPGNVWAIPDNPESSVWKISMINGTFKERVGWHPAQQPLELVLRVVSGLTNPGDLVVDPFAGSATTNCACRILGRECVSFERSSRYVDEGNRRIEAVDPKGFAKLRQRYPS